MQDAIKALQSADSATKISLLKQANLMAKSDPKTTANLLLSLTTLALDTDHHVHIGLLNLITTLLSTKEPLVHVYPTIIDILTILTTSQDPLVLKKSVAIVIDMFNRIFKLCCANIQLVALWQKLLQLKAKIILLLSHRNEGVRVMVIKFIASFIAVQSPSPDPNDLSINDIPRNHPFLNPKELSNEAQIFMKQLLAILDANAAYSNHPLF
jgi:hypothetical protein